MAAAEDLRAAVETLVEARLLLRAGHIRYTARLAADAVELALKARYPLPEALRRPEINASSKYRYRRERAWQDIGLPRQVLSRLHDLRLVDRFHEDGDGAARVLNEPEAEWAVDEATEILFALVRAAPVPEPVRRELYATLSDVDDPAPEEELLAVAEQQVGWGQYDTALAARLLRLEHRFAVRGSQRARWYRTEAMRLRGHTAMNQNRLQGPDGAIALAEQAEVVWRDIQERDRFIQARTVQSVSYRNLGDPGRSLAILREAIDAAGNHPGRMDVVAAELASIQMALGEPAGALDTLRGPLDRAQTAGNCVHEGRALQQMGKALMRVGRLVEAEVAMLRGQSLVPPDYLIAHCVGANALAELYARCGDQREAHRWAETTRLIATHKGFQHQLNQLEETIRAYPGIW